MYDFQIRIFKKGLRDMLVWMSPSSTFEALRQARENADHGDTLEVWRDDECVHREVVEGAGP